MSHQHKDNVRFTDPDTIFKYGFAQVPTVILRSSILSQTAKLLFAVLLSYAWQKNHCYPSMELLEQDLGIKRQAISRYISELKLHGLIRVERSKSVPPRNIYFIETRISVIQHSAILNNVDNVI